VRHYVWVNVRDPYWGTYSLQLQEQTKQRVDYVYDTNLIDGTGNGAGRLASVVFQNESGSKEEQFSYQYVYNPAGRVLKQRLQMLPWQGTIGNGTVNLDVTYGWDNEGKMTSQLYPGDDSGHSYSYQFGAMSRPSSMIAGCQSMTRRAVEQEFPATKPASIIWGAIFLVGAGPDLRVLIRC
jgi:hypothetical protein